ncbi:MAG: hypothetical protein R3D71_05255 [Rickettsiales bacterium]
MGIQEDFLDDKITLEEIEPLLQPGCKFEHKTERKQTIEAGKPIQHWKRRCTRIVDCDDSANNRDWFCREWEKTDDY